ncbi:MAG: diguanylate cyclase, partial [Hyphomonadaceae bacterium]
MRSAEKDPGKAARRSRSIAARFTVFVCVLLLVVGATAVLVLRGETERQSREHVRGIMREVGAAYAPRFAAYVSAGGQTDRRPLDVFMEMPFVTEVNLTDAAGIRIASRTRPGAALDGERLVLPLTHEGARVGTLSFTVARQRLVAGDPFSFWLPFALLAAVVLAAIPLTAIMVRRAMTPLRQLTAFAEGVAASRLAERIEIRTGDEFETLAGAFNHMMARLDASVRRIQRLAFVDPVTELPNADRLQRDLRAAIAAAAQEGTPGALFLLQLERLHKAGETLGKEAAHDLVNATALRLASAVKAADPWAEAGAVACARAPMLARLAGDEFAILFPSLPRGVELRGLANALMQPFEQPFEWRVHRVSFSCHLGAAFFPRDGRDAEEVMR